jgi:hypothetical protein
MCVVVTTTLSPYARWDGEQSPTGSSGWLERAVARPDHVLMDLARVLAPAVLTDALNVTNHLANSGPAGTVRARARAVCLAFALLLLLAAVFF